jgi:hypothetical protein
MEAFGSLGLLAQTRHIVEGRRSVTEPPFYALPGGEAASLRPVGGEARADLVPNPRPNASKSTDGGRRHFGSPDTDFFLLTSHFPPLGTRPRQSG